MSRLRTVAGVINLVCCEACNANVPVFQFEGEGDASTLGLCSAGSCKNRELVIVEATPSEWSEIAHGSSNLLQGRIAAQLIRSDLHVLKVIKVKSTVKRPVLGFSMFRKRYVSSTIVYQCPCCTVGQAIVRKELSLTEFVSMGGKVTTLGNLRI